MKTRNAANRRFARRTNGEVKFSALYSVPTSRSQKAHQSESPYDAG
jgi:ribosomal protein L35